jgi:hypothetical protein
MALCIFVQPHGPITAGSPSLDTRHDADPALWMLTGTLFAIVNMVTG